MATNFNRPGAWLAGTVLLALAVPAAQLLAQTPPGPTAPTAANPWTNLAPFPTPSEEVLGATADGKLYVFAGLAPGWKPKAMVQEFDPAANSWTQKKPMPLASHHVAFATLNNKIYAFGGFKLPESGPAAWEPINNAWEYDPAADTWKELAPMPTKRGAAAAAAVDGKLYVVGGATTMRWRPPAAGSGRSAAASAPRSSPAAATPTSSRATIRQPTPGRRRATA